LFSKTYKYLKKLNNHISQNCQQVRRAFVFRGELECQCDFLEAVLEDKDTVNHDHPQTYGEGYFTGANQRFVAEVILTKAAVRVILANETDEIKHKEYKELYELAGTLESNCSARQAAERQRIAKEKKDLKNRF